MYYSNYENQPPEQEPQEVNQLPIESAKVPKKHWGMRVTALCLTCALVGGLAGGAGGYLAGREYTEQTTIYTGERPATVVDVAQVSTGQELTPAEIYATYVESTVGITVESVTTNVFGQPVRNAAAGSGFVISEDGYILTNHHVIDGASAIRVSFVDGTTYEARLVGSEAGNDIAVLKIEANDLTPVVIGDSEKMHVGEEVVAIGNPLGELTYSLTGGYISALDRSIAMGDGTVMNMMQTDAAINSGNSGGPLFNRYGEVIGITTAKYSGDSNGTSASIEGIGFAVPLADVELMIQDIIEYGYVTGKPFLGITVATVTESDAQRYGMPMGAFISTVSKGSPAEQAGLRAQDIILSFGEAEIKTATELITAKNEYKAGESVEITYIRSGQPAVTTTVVLGEELPVNSGENTIMPPQKG